MSRWLLLVALGACGASPAEPDAAGAPDAEPMAPDATFAIPRPGFGTIAGMCGDLTAADLASPASARFDLSIDFAADRYDDPGERPALTPGGQLIVSSDNAGCSSIFSETFAYELLARCELAELVKLEVDIAYDVEGDKTDLLVSIDGTKLGVSVTRAVRFPFGQPYEPAAATALIESKLAGILESTANVSAADAWSKQLLVTLAYDPQHAQVFRDAWDATAAELRADTILVLAVTDGDDLFIYTDD